MATLSRYVLTADVTMPWPATWSEIIQGQANSPVVTPAVPGTTVAVTNGNPLPVLVSVTGGTVTLVQVGSATVATSSPATAVVEPGGSITLTYSAAPAWAWATAQLPHSGSSSMTAAVSATAPAGGQAGIIPEFTWFAGQPLVLDPDGQLYAALSGSLREWTDGTDNVSHYGLSNLWE
jgi:hypothetical protein